MMKFSNAAFVVLLAAGNLAAPLAGQQAAPARLPGFVRIETRGPDQVPPSRPLRPASDSSTAEDAAQGNATLSQSVVRVAGSLAIVLALFFFLIWLLRRLQPRQARQLPGSVFELLGTATLSARHTVQLIRFGNKLLLVSLAAGHASTLAEVTDPDEIEQLLMICTPSRATTSPGHSLKPVKRDEFQHVLDHARIPNDARIVG